MLVLDMYTKALIWCGCSVVAKIEVSLYCAISMLFYRCVQPGLGTKAREEVVRNLGGRKPTTDLG